MKATTKRAGARAARSEAYHHGNLRPALIARAAELLEEQGAAALSLRLVARQLGVSQTAPYHHFADKGELLAAVAADGYRQLRESTLAAPLKDFPLARRVRGLCVGYVRFAKAKPELFRLMFGREAARKSDYDELSLAAAASFAALQERVAELITDFGLSHLDVKFTTLAIWSLGHGMANLLIDRPISPTVTAAIGDGREMVDRVTALFVAGCQPRP